MATGWADVETITLPSGRQLDKGQPRIRVKGKQGTWEATRIQVQGDRIQVEVVGGAKGQSRVFTGDKIVAPSRRRKRVTA